MASSSGKQPDLDRALSDWRRDRPSDGGLSQPARANIMRAALEASARPRRIEPQIPLFFPVRRLALATALPTMLLCVIAGYLLLPGAVVEPAGGPAGTIVQTMRQGDEVVFVIANGNTTHTVRKSNDPRSLSDGETFTVSQGSFRDRAEDDSDLVFYRID
jgi:hypothetical protein